MTKFDNQDNAAQSWNDKSHIRRQQVLLKTYNMCFVEQLPTSEGSNLWDKTAARCHEEPLPRTTPLPSNECTVATIQVIDGKVRNVIESRRKECTKSEKTMVMSCFSVTTANMLSVLTHSMRTTAIVVPKQHEQCRITPATCTKHESLLKPIAKI